MTTTNMAFKWCVLTLDNREWFMAKHYGTHWVGWGYAYETKEEAINAFAKAAR